ncbi:DUF3040 domain-containing protein [Brachybacterium phenoliresistens]|uniref:DUF3040 domain-containing protein n=1 Tax=Brachybacterium phenoliresistens TaxID=396014 RepID=Z9JU04_9MICO|nr:DUF3040 domain-containing protein [Brachybacterium phenoliresistens]EWS81247.1 hypothetical protein BF93_18945 [Brachybacterium phenoliresistens]
MPLSEHEQKMLDEMERQLFADDPRLARTFQASTRPRRSRRRLVLGLVGAVLGLGALVLAVLLPAIWLGVLGFLLMLAGTLYAVTAPPAEPGSAPGAAPATGQGPDRHRGDFMRRMEERWEKRGGDDPRG